MLVKRENARFELGSLSAEQLELLKLSVEYHVK